MADQSLGGAVYTIRLDDARFERDMKRAEATARRTGQAMGDDLGRGTRHAALGFLELSRAVEDAQYGFSAVVNNIPQIALMFGGSAGIAAGASLAAVAISQLVKHVGDLRDLIGGAWLGVPAEELTKLRERAEEAQEALDRLTKLRPKGEGEAARALVSAMQEGDPEAVVRATRESVMRDNALRPRQLPGDAVEIMKRAMFKAMRPGETKGYKDLTEEARGDILGERAAEATRDILGHLDEHGPAGDKARRDMKRLIESNPKAFPAGMLGDIERMDPARQKAQEKLEREGDLNSTNLTNEMRLRKEQSDREHQQREWEIQGRKQALDTEKRWASQHLQDERKTLQEQVRRAEHRLSPAQRQQLQDRLMGGAQRKDSEVLSTREYVNRTQTSALNQVPKQQLDQLVRMNKNLDQINRKITDVGRMR
jgi:hypothetical protein